jgi:hypothetical protein
MAVEQLIGGLSTGLGLANGAQGFAPPVNNAVSGFLNFLSPNTRPDVQMLLTMFHRSQINEQEFYKWMRFNGYDENTAFMIHIMSLSHYSLNDYATLYRRGVIDLDRYINRTQLLGIDEEDREKFLKLSEYFPSPSDLVTFAVREVYSPEEIEKYGHDKEIPDQFIKECFKAGLPEDQAKNYWKSHWNYPSIGEVMEMLHRRATKPDGKVFGSEDFATFLKVADYSPYWRNMLEQISYIPLTRVDVRRMYSLGIIDREKVKDNFLDLGYNQENAELMTTFTTVYDNPDTADLTRPTLTTAYINSEITLDELVDYMGQIGYLPKMLNFWVKDAQYKKTKAQIQLRVDSLFEQFLAGGTALDDLRNELHRMNLQIDQVDILINEALIKKQSKRKIPGVETIIGWLEKGVIDEGGYALRMRLLNYSMEDITNYIHEINLKQDTSQRKYVKVDVYVRWLKAGVIDDKYFSQILTEQGYSPRDIQSFIIEMRSKQNAIEGTS